MSPAALPATTWLMRMACRAGGCEIEVLPHRVEGLCLVGQTTAGDMAVPGRQPALTNEDGVVLERAMTDPRGEFDLMGGHGGRCGLRVGPGSSAPCVPLGDGVRT